MPRQSRRAGKWESEMTKELFHDSETYEIYEFLKFFHKRISCLSNQSSDNVKIRRLTDKFFDECVKVLYDEEVQEDHNPEAVYQNWAA